MTCSAILREPRFHVIRVGGAVVVLRVTGVAVGGYTLEVSAHVTRAAIERRMNASQRKVRELRVIEFRSKPAVHAVTHGAIRREPQSSMVEHRG